MFEKSDLETMTIFILTKNPDTFFNEFAVFNSLNKLYAKDELFIGHFLFVWEKLLLNDNFIEKKINNNQVLIKIKSFMNIESEPSKNQVDNPITVNFNEQIIHMITYPNLYKGSKIIDSFLLNMKNLPKKYNSIYEILNDKELNIGYNDLIKFIDLYYDNNYLLVDHPDNSYILYQKTSNNHIIKSNKRKKEFIILLILILYYSLFKMFRNKTIFKLVKRSIYNYIQKFNLK